jgi:hypothetical protein
MFDMVSPLILGMQAKDVFTLRRWREGGVAVVSSHQPPHLLEWRCTISVPTCHDSVSTAVPSAPTGNAHENVCFAIVERIRY